MGRPPLPLGTHGQIRYYRVGRNWQARVLHRDYDGVVRHIERIGTSKGASQRALMEALRDRARTGSTAEIRPDTKLATVAEAWWAGFVDDA